MTAIILYNTVPLFVYVDQLWWYCVFVCSNVHWQLVYALCDGFFYYLSLRAES